MANYWKMSDAHDRARAEAGKRRKPMARLAVMHEETEQLKKLTKLSRQPRLGHSFKSKPGG